ncbi:structural protein [Roseomonas eburnea]|uniref:Structural protein n=1 Tax=Neoroseomonas eburnea TaxID=1346889 RepID=A0A9X9XGB1_9PROT|nr:structural protein [Neoroseomonas eburnea]MBR0682747.1 structural protein [Neoroseomonas eburnea]
MDPRQSRGFRNRNPGNIDHVPANRWQGLADPPLEPPPPGGGRPRFARFVSHEYGIRALAMLLTTYQDRHGLRTIRGIVSRWAPGSENNTAAYIRHVAELMNRDPGETLDLHTYADLRPLVQAIITHELGGNPYDRATIDAGLRLAGVPKPVQTVREAAATGTGQGAITVGAAAAAAATAAPAIQAVGGLPMWVGVALVVAAAAVAIAYVLSRRKTSAEHV